MKFSRGNVLDLWGVYSHEPISRVDGPGYISTNGHEEFHFPQPSKTWWIDIEPDGKVIKCREHLTRADRCAVDTSVVHFTKEEL